GVTYHVQTEDKGLETPLILSLVYVGGAIIASKRTPYEDLLARGFDEKALTERLNRQHKLICAAIRAGRVAELKRMGGPAQTEKPGDAEGRPTSERGKTQRKKKSDATQAAARPVEAGATVEAADAGATREEVFEQVERIVEEVKPAGEAEKSSDEEAAKSSDDEIIILTTLVDEIAALGGATSYQPPTFKSQPIEPLPLHEEIPVAPKPAAPPTPAPPQTFEQPAPLPQESADELYLTLLDDEGDFRAGQLVMIKVHVGRGAYGQRAVVGAQVTVKVLGTTFRPLILASTTDGTGVAVVRALLPRFTSGRAAIIIRAVDGEDAAEMRRIIHQA
ncbi:MAG: hypothetical protein M3444_14650, partial [Acidobacteriota bacterium]|nr:hypothetical protein [Acidobacteriota bacterium]